MSLRLIVGLAVAVLSGLVGTAQAEDINYVEVFRQNAIQCIHRTANPDKVEIEVLRPPQTVGDVTTVRFKTYYEGWIKKNMMETEMMIRQAGSIRQMKINQLADTGTSLGSCDLEKNWHDF